ETLVDALALSRGRFNKGLNSPRPSYLTVLLGEPRADYDDSCQPPTNPRLVERLERRDLGPFAVTMIKPALDSLARVLDRLRRAEPEIYTRLGTAGALCARLVRGSDSAVSTHSWGIAVDLTVAGELDRLGDDGTQFALVLLADFFNAEGWYWGAEYRREDSMHFEVSEQTLRAWVEEGLL
ncbi:MAG: M15 family metallopeptidase, partial [Pseudomonadota bacterium]